MRPAFSHRRWGERGGTADLSLWAAHYIYTTPSVQYKRLFEIAAGQVNQRSAAHERPFCRIDRKRCSGQDTVGFALAVG
ncbi:hypothetical protein C1889_28555 [Pseudomonas sp. FW507-12TSA]|nr:hypothetical protein C1889_28555 [Pseudomonas sp. FW507-12TSA]